MSSGQNVAQIIKTALGFATVETHVFIKQNPIYKVFHLICVCENESIVQ